MRSMNRAWRLRLSLLTAALGVATAAPVTTAPAALTRGDLRWLARVTFGIDTATVAHYQQLGREKFLDEQLHPAAADPADLAAAIAAIPSVQQTAVERMKATRAEQQRINTLPNEDEKQKARMALNQAGNQAVYETTKRHLMRALRIAVAAARADDLVLDESLQRLLRARPTSAGRWPSTKSRRCARTRSASSAIW